ncbi:MAG: hypothetical protein A3K03_13340 [Bdellovibrionales bacterium RIFOXYD1_FULL_44_7]|nr:MAG: hypothetical protein A3K03_13340 [Bdellovibrionales bacterium RIFOXYD1_FULL_44_7]
MALGLLKSQANMPNNVLSLNALRAVKNAKNEINEDAYRATILGMSKLELLEEMVRFQEERSRIGELTPTMMVRGKHLFKALEANAETQELRILTGAYRRHLEFELIEYLKSTRGC